MQSKYKNFEGIAEELASRDDKGKNKQSNITDIREHLSNLSDMVFEEATENGFNGEFESNTVGAILYNNGKRRALARSENESEEAK